MSPPGTDRERLSSAKNVFVGTVQQVTHGGKGATVLVESTWRGAATSTVTVAGGTLQDGTASSVDRLFDVGRRYLFVPYERRGGVFRDNICTDTRPWRPRLERLRPEGAQPVAAGQPSEAPAPGTPEPPEPAPQRGRSVLLWAAVATGLAGGGGAVGLRRRARR